MTSDGLKGRGWQLSSDHRVWIDWKYGFGKISEHEFDHNLKGREKKSAHVNYDGHKWVYFTRHPSLPFQTFGGLCEKARKEKFLPNQRGNCLGMYGTYRKIQIAGMLLLNLIRSHLLKIPSCLANPVIFSQTTHFYYAKAYMNHTITIIACKVFLKKCQKIIFLLPPRWSPRDICCWSEESKYAAAEDIGPPIGRGPLGGNGAGV